MSTGVSFFLIAVGAILYFAVSKSVNGLNLDTVGVILMLVGALGLVISVVMIAMTRSRARNTTIQAAPVQRSTTVVQEDLR